MGALILTKACTELWRKLEMLEKDRGIPIPMFCVAFEVANDYLNSPEKDRDYWRNQLFLRNYERYLKKFKNLKLPDHLKDLEKGRKLLQNRLKRREVSQSEWELLTDLAKPDIVKMYHWAASQTSLLELEAFVERMGKHPIEYMVEDMKDDIPNYFELQLSIQRAEEGDDDK
jgi:hypothetical protein